MMTYVGMTSVIQGGPSLPQIAPKMQQLHCIMFVQHIKNTNSCTVVDSGLNQVRGARMKATRLAIPAVIHKMIKVFADNRGFFFESLNQTQFKVAIGRNVNFAQDTHSRAVQNVLRSLHYQIQQPEGKPMRVVADEMFNVVVVIRKSLSTFWTWAGEIFNADNKRQMT